MTRTSIRRAEGAWGEAYLIEPDEVFSISSSEIDATSSQVSTGKTVEFLYSPQIIDPGLKSIQTWLMAPALTPFSQPAVGKDRPLPSPEPTPPQASKAKNVTDNISRDELAARLETIEARNDARFEKIMGEIKTSNAALAGKVDVIGARSAGKWTVWGAAGSIIVAMIATIIVLLQVMQSGYDTGRDAEKSINEAVERATSPQQPAPKLAE